MTDIVLVLMVYSSCVRLYKYFVWKYLSILKDVSLDNCFGVPKMRKSLSILAVIAKRIMSYFLQKKIIDHKHIAECVCFTLLVCNASIYYIYLCV